MFAKAKAHGRAAFMPYFPIGYPSYDESLAIIESLAQLGVDGFEIGIPFSDPLADGPVIQAASQKALENGATLTKCLEGVAELRRRGVQQPMMMMGYMNPFLRYGVEQFARDARAAGADGVIVPDLPPEEGAHFAEACRREGLGLVFFLAPTSDAERIALVAQRASGFIYVVSLTGVTGARAELPPDLTDFIQRVRSQSADVPLVLGFGISQPEHVRAVQRLVDGFIVGSAVVRAGADGVDAARALIQRLMPADAL
jgi:tryptophan synthase alpha chain